MTTENPNNNSSSNGAAKQPSPDGFKQKDPSGGNGQQPKASSVPQKTVAPITAEIPIASLLTLVCGLVAQDLGPFVARTDTALNGLNGRLDKLGRQLQLVAETQCPRQETQTTINALLNAVESVERTIARQSSTGVEEGLFHPDSVLALEEVRQDFQVELSRLGVEAFGVQPGETFDCVAHCPIDRVPTTKPNEHGRIASQVRPGFRNSKDQKVIRKAIVRLFDGKTVLISKEK